MSKLKKFGVFVIIIFLGVLIWYNIPNPKSIKFEPFDGLDPINSTITYEVGISKIELKLSIFSEISSLATSFTKYSNIIKLVDEINSVIDTNKNLKTHKEKIEIPVNAGGDSVMGISTYIWKKTYKRFFSKKELEENNIIILINNNIYYFKYDINNSFIIKGTLYVGKLL